MLILWGEQDPFQPLEVGRRLATGLRNARLVTFQNTGHWARDDSPGEISREIQDFAR